MRIFGHRVIVLLGMMWLLAGCEKLTSPQPSPRGEGVELPRPAATPSQRGTDSVVLDEEYYRRMWLLEAVGAGEVELDK